MRRIYEIITSDTAVAIAFALMLVVLVFWRAEI